MVLTRETVNKDLALLQAGCEEKFLTEQECLYFLEHADTDMMEHLIRRNFAKGDACHALLKGEDLASYGWYSTVTSVLPSGVMLSFDRSYVYMYQGYTPIAYRGQPWTSSSQAEDGQNRPAGDRRSSRSLRKEPGSCLTESGTSITGTSVPARSGAPTHFCSSTTSSLEAVER